MASRRKQDAPKPRLHYEDEVLRAAVRAYIESLNLPHDHPVMRGLRLDRSTPDLLKMFDAGAMRDAATAALQDAYVEHEVRAWERQQQARHGTYPGPVLKEYLKPKGE